MVLHFYLDGSVFVAFMPPLAALLSAPGRLPFRGRLPFFPLIRPVYAWEHGFSLAVEDGIFLDFFLFPGVFF